ncbi:Programmed cell death protein 2 C-terminal domain-containing protein [Madurella fahalii]|uniref:Programmed cell death protein 2 C-terminal domain-containing protein n=1 Tax=Madurella fahalii TaxID=1157608 RepID=A0ABQ0GJD7_9PEZI
MAPYDSDSSGAEDDDFTETNVLLGYASADANGEEISRLGGRPDWLDGSKPPSAALARCKVCNDLMVLLMQLNCELPDRFPGHERRLYVLTCKRKACRRKDGSVRAIRGIRVSADRQHAAVSNDTKENRKEKEIAAPKAASQGLGEALFGVKPATTGAGTAPRANPFATSSSSPAATNPFAPKQSPSPAPTNPFSQRAATPEKEATKPDPGPTITAKDLPKTFADALNLNNTRSEVTHGPPPPPEPWPEESAQPAPYPVRWLADAEYETLDPTPPPVASTGATSFSAGAMDLNSGEGGASGSGSGSGSGGGKEDKDVFESSMDSTFHKFADRVGQNPDQCIRYEFAGQPLLYSKADAVGKMLHGTAGGGEKVVVGGKGMPRCGNCGAGRVFEVQLTPHAIEELEIDEDGLDGMDWGTIIVGVCERDCQERGVKIGEAGYVEEWAGVQWEELTMKR